VALPRCGAIVKLSSESSALALQSSCQGVGVHYRTAGDVDERGRRFHEGELLPADQPARGVGERHGEHDKVGLGKQIVERRPAGAKLLGVGRGAAVVIEHLHGKAVGAAGDLLADPAQADDAERSAMNFPPQHVARIVTRERGASRIAIAFGKPPAGGEKQRKRHVGGGAVEHARRVADGNVPLRGGRDVDVVDADSKIAHHAHGRQAIEQRTIDARVAERVNGGGRWMPVERGLPRRDLDLSGEQLDDVGGERRVGDNDRQGGHGDVSMFYRWAKLRKSSAASQTPCSGS
jgi:hypothetical protein